LLRLPPFAFASPRAIRRGRREPPPRPPRSVGAPSPP
jgi:hypothetical protein